MLLPSRLFFSRHSLIACPSYPYYPDSRLVVFASVVIVHSVLHHCWVLCHGASYSFLVLVVARIPYRPRFGGACMGCLRLCQSAVLQCPSPRPSLQAQPAARVLWRGIQVIDRSRPVNCPDLSGLWEKSWTSSQGTFGLVPLGCALC
jgi:hypothetical protein